MSKQHPHLGGFALLPAKKGTCEVCATAHPPEQPHNQQSMFYQYDFYGKQGRWPTWEDAMAHCTPEMKAHWTQCLAELGIKLKP